MSETARAKYKCQYCNERNNDHQCIIEHLLEKHEDVCVAFRVLTLNEETGRLGYMKKSYESLIPCNLKKEKKYIKGGDNGEVLVVSHHSENTPHNKKMVRAESPGMAQTGPNEESCSNNNKRSRRTLDFKDAEVNDTGLFYGFLKQFSDILAGKPVKLAVDGKKISRGRGHDMGDVDCWGYEKSPTLNERKECLKADIALIDSIFLQVDKNTSLSVLSSKADCMSNILFKIKQIVRSIGTRLADLRAMIASLQRSTDKFITMGGENWRKSRYQFIISCLRTTKYDNEKAVEEGLRVVNQLLLLGSCITGKQHLFELGNSLNLVTQANYVALTVVCGKIDDPNTWRFIQQRSDDWFAVRKLAKVTGSTCHAALGLDTLKKQQQHFDKVVYDREPVVKLSAVQKQNMQYGTDHEIHAVATLLSKVMPVYYPDVKFHEEGCVGIQHKGVPFLVSSPDGSLRISSELTPLLMCEIKCKTKTTNTMPVYYELPRYYVMQILSEMAAYNCPNLIFACWSEISTVVIEVKFDEELWNKAWDQLVVIYDPGNEKRPSKVCSETRQLKDAIGAFHKLSCRLLGEFPSISSLHNYTKMNAITEYSIEDALKDIQVTKRWIETAYQLTRKEATEILVFMMNDLDRQFHEELTNSFPVAYAMKGPSMSTLEFRQIFDHVIEECTRHNINILITSADGQWHNYGVRDVESKPLTLLQLQRDVWNEAKSMQKSEILRILKSVNAVKSTNIEQCILFEKDESGRLMINGHLLYGHLPKVKASCFQTIPEDTTSKECCQSSITSESDRHNLEELLHDTQGNHIDAETMCIVEETLNGCNIVQPNSQTTLFDTIPGVIGDALQVLYAGSDYADNAFDDEYSELGNRVVNVDYENRMPGMNYTDQQTCQQISCDQIDLYGIGFDHIQNTILCDSDVLQMQYELSKSKIRNRPDWASINGDEFKAKFSNAQSIDTSFTRNELVSCLKVVIDKLKAHGMKCAISWSKSKLVNLFSDCLGASSEAEPKVRRKLTPLPLKLQCVKVVSSKYSKELLNVIMAEYNWPKALRNWHSDIHTLQRLSPIIDVGNKFGLEWFSKPSAGVEKVRFHFTDSCHILTCIRSKVCTTGIEGLQKSAWRNAAFSTSTKLNISLIDECVDKQSVEFAKTVFAPDVQESMLTNGYKKEALFCNLIYSWFSSEDYPGISALDRCFQRLKLREWLMEGVEFGNFPPNTGYVKGIPIVTYEAILVNIERKLQMFPYCTNQSYNVRSTGTQELEQFFGTFRDLDPTGSGTPKPDDIPLMLGRVIDICNCRYDSSRCFYMSTSKATVYPEVTYDDYMEICEETNIQSRIVRDHFFDKKERTRVTKKHKKRVSVSSPHRPARGETGVRQYHRTDESKLLPHLRRGLEDIPN